MVGLAIASILIGVALLYFAVHPRVAFLLEVGWKFKGDTAPSDAYVGMNLAVRAGAGVIAIVMGIVLLSQNSDSHAQDAALRAYHRCHDELLPKFDRAIEWNDTRVANPGELRSLATQLGVEVTIQDDPPATDGAPSGDLVRVLDPDRPGEDKLAFRYLGAFHDQYWATPNHCEHYQNGTGS